MPVAAARCRRDTGGFADSVAGCEQLGSQRRDVDIYQGAVAFDDLTAGDDGVDQAGVSCADDGGDRVGDREDGQIVGA
jgi:hypothetical protein